jgi:hypothetical protein
LIERAGGSPPFFFRTVGVPRRQAYAPAASNFDPDVCGARRRIRLAMGRFCLLIVLLVAPFGALADIYKCADGDGNVIYTNTKQKGCTAMDIGPYREPAPAAARPKARSQSPAPANFPNVDSDTQKQRDQGRRRILETELAAEEKLLADAKRAFAEGEIGRSGEDRTSPLYTDRLRKLKETVGLHEQNVAALKRELAGTR